MSAPRPNIKFELTAAQSERVRSWVRRHVAAVGQHGRDFTGFGLEYVIRPSGMADSIQVRCLWCPADPGIDVTMDDDGDFVYNEDGTKNGW